MKQLIIFLYVLGVYTPSTSFSQGKNRLSIQTGLFHCFFDNSAIVNKPPDYDFKRKFSNLFGSVLNDSKGIQFSRQIKGTHTISLEYMILRAGYITSFPLNYNSTPLIYTRAIKTFNLSYHNRCLIGNNFYFTYGGGMLYQWGIDAFLISNNFAGWGYEAQIDGYSRKDFGLNLRTGIEYQVNKWLTLYSNINFSGIVYLNTKDHDGTNTNTFYKEKYGMKNTPSRTDLSLNFGIGFNF